MEMEKERPIDRLRRLSRKWRAQDEAWRKKWELRDETLRRLRELRKLRDEQRAD